MQPRRSYSTSPRSLLLTTFSIFLVGTLVAGCTGTDDVPETDQGEGQTEYTDVELFAGLMFAQGPVASEVDPIREHWAPQNYVDDSERLQQLQDLNQGIAEGVAEEYPEFMASFREAVLSGDRTEIETALNRGAVVSVQLVSQMEEVQEIRSQIRENPDQAEQILESSIEFERENFTPPPDQSVEQLQKSIDQFAAGEFDLDEIPRPLNIDYATYCYLYRHTTVANIQHFLRDYAVIIDSDINLDRIYFSPGTRVIGGQNQDYSLLHEQTIDGIAEELGR